MIKGLLEDNKDLKEKLESLEAQLKAGEVGISGQYDTYTTTGGGLVDNDNEYEEDYDVNGPTATDETSNLFNFQYTPAETEEEMPGLGLNWDTLELLTILENGNIGIGNSNPEYKLSVDGVIESTYGGFRFPDGTIQTTASSVGLLEKLFGVDSIITTKPGMKLMLRGAMRFLASIKPSSPESGDIYSDGTDLFYYNGSEWEELTRTTKEASLWSQNGTKIFIYNTGNVGIGTSDPAQKLHTNGNIRADGRHLFLGEFQEIFGNNLSAIYYDSNNSTVTQMIFRDKENTPYGRVYGGGNGKNFGLMDGDGNWSYRARKGVFTSFLINNSEKVRITSAGNVGIGTTVPGQALDVAGNIAVSGTVDGVDVSAMSASDGMDYDSLADLQGAVSNDFHNLGGTDATDDTVIYTEISGIVGTGTSTVAAGDDSRFHSRNADYALAAADGTPVDAVYVDNAGSVGIGDTTPSQELTVAGDAVVGGSTSETETLANAGFTLGGDDLFVAGTAGVEGVIYTDAGLTVGSSTTYADGSITKSNSGPLSITLNGAAGDDFIVGTDTLVVESDNNRVGIGTTLPGAALEVNGNIIAGVPTADNHLTTKAYVDAAGGGGCYVSYSGSCLSGFTSAGSAGSWGDCGDYYSSSDHFRPPGGGCSSGWYSSTIGTAYVCCQ